MHTSLVRQALTILALDLAFKSGIVLGSERKPYVARVHTHEGGPVDLKRHLENRYFKRLANHSINGVYIETLHVARNMKTVRSLCERTGFIRYWLLDMWDTASTMVNLRGARMHLGCRTKADVGIYFRDWTDDPDEADALCIYAWAVKRKSFRIIRERS